jgi:cytochrome P450
VSDLDSVDFFRGDELIPDPYPYFDRLRSTCPVQREPHHGVVMVTGYKEAVSVYTDPATSSSCNSVTGPFPGFPVPLEGDDVSALIEEHRDALPFSDQITTFDPPKHKAHRGLLMRLLTPRRLRENEDFMWRRSDRQIDGFIDRGTWGTAAPGCGATAILHRARSGAIRARPVPRRRRRRTPPRRGAYTSVNGLMQPKGSVCSRS